MFSPALRGSAVRHISATRTQCLSSSSKKAIRKPLSSAFLEDISRYEEETESPDTLSSFTEKLANSPSESASGSSQETFSVGETTSARRFVSWKDTRFIQPQHHRKALSAIHYANIKHPIPEWDGKNLFMTEGHEQRGSLSRQRVPQRWLRDHCQCHKCTHPETKQRQYETFQHGPTPQIEECDIQIDEPPSSVQVKWRDGHESVYPLDFLQGRQSANKEAYRRGIYSQELWGSDIAANAPSVAYRNVQLFGVATVLRNIRKYGFCFIPGCPVTPEDTKELLELIGPIRNTHYGGFYDFTSNMASKDTAYTDLALDVHTDTTYFSDPAGLQAFHMLSHTDGEGGKSVLVDGFNAASKLFEEDQGQTYVQLARTGVYWHASGNEDVSVQPYSAFPVLEHDPVRKHLFRVRWNNSDRAGLNTSIDKTDGWYSSAFKFNNILANPSMQYWFQLQPGTPLIFDNWRILHGRSQFTGKRRMCGGYINYDDYISKFRLTNYGRDTVLATTFTG